MKNIREEVKLAISWLASEYKYTKNLNHDLKLLFRALEETNIRKQVIALNQAKKDLRQIGRSEKKAQKHEERVADAVEYLLENHRFGPDSHRFNEEEIIKLEKELHVATNKLIFLASRYQGEIKKIYGELVGVIKTKNRKNSETKIRELKERVEEVISWIRAEVALIKKAQEVGKTEQPEDEESIHNLKEEIYAKAGVLVYMWGFDTPKYNDYLKNGKETYTRGIHKIREENIGTSDFNEIINHIQQRMTNGGYTLFKDSHGTNNIVIYGALSSTQSKGEIIPSPISEFVTRNSNNPAYYAYIQFPTNATDHAGRTIEDAILIIISTSSMINKIIHFLFDNPKDYWNLIKTIIDPQKFPNFNKEILSKRIQLVGELSKIYFIFTDSEQFVNTTRQRISRNLKGSALNEVSEFVVEIPQHQEV
jgi:hypothetical protein